MTTPVRIPPTLRGEVGGQRQVEATGDTVRELLEDLAGQYPSLGTQILADGDIAPFVNVYLGGEDVRTLDGLETPVAAGQTLILLPAMAGGEAAPAARVARSSLDLIGSTPLVGSSSSWPDSSCAASTIFSATRSLIEPVGFWPSSFA